MSSGSPSGSRYDLGFPGRDAPLVQGAWLLGESGPSPFRGSPNKLVQLWYIQRLYDFLLKAPGLIDMPWYLNLCGCWRIRRESLRRGVPKAVRFNHLLKDFDEPPSGM